jgi:Arc/MetJ-type ribon-helix-helix transcriptional regulator
VGAQVNAARARKPPNDAILLIRIPEHLRETVARVAYASNKSLSEAVREALTEWLVKHG